MRYPACQALLSIFSGRFAGDPNTTAFCTLAAAPCSNVGLKLAIHQREHLQKPSETHIGTCPVGVWITWNLDTVLDTTVSFRECSIFQNVFLHLVALHEGQGALLNRVAELPRPEVGIERFGVPDCTSVWKGLNSTCSNDFRSDSLLQISEIWGAWREALVTSVPCQGDQVIHQVIQRPSRPSGNLRSPTAGHGIP